MIDANNIETIRSIRQLYAQVRNPKPIVFWVGAGASSWCKYPRWLELADKFHSKFARNEKNYDTSKGLNLISKNGFPEFFQFCKETNSKTFYSLLVDSFPQREPTPVYKRFVAALGEISPSFILTTNIDEMLEKALPAATTVSRYDLERVQQLLVAEQPFICKLHGSISDIKSTIFTTKDYEALTESKFSTFMGRILASTTVIFLGYSLQDDYVISTLAQNNNISELFGDGPHFAILSDEHDRLPSNVRVIRYKPEPHKDHRSSITIVEEIRSLRNQKKEPDRPFTTGDGIPQNVCSAHLLFHIFPPGTWNVSHRIDLTDLRGKTTQLIVGSGFSTEELHVTVSTAMHDIIVGLLCFDHLYAPIDSIDRVHHLLGSERFWRFVENDLLSFVNWTHEEGVIFPDEKAVSKGKLDYFLLQNSDETTLTNAQIIRKQLKPVPGKEANAERLFSKLETSTQEIVNAGAGSIPDIVRSLLLRRSIRKLLGISEGAPLNSITRWNVFPILRLANVVKIGAACRVLKIGSAKLDFGTAKLAGPAFASAMGAEWADDTASYVLAGRYNADLGAIALQDSSILDSILTFRETKIGEELRQEVFSRLSANEGAEVNVAINSGLRNAIPTQILQNARDNFVNLLIPQPQQTIGNIPPAIWNNNSFSEASLMLWRKKSREILEEYCRKNNISPYKACPCGSGEKLKFCCREALEN